MGYYRRQLDRSGGRAQLLISEQFLRSIVWKELPLLETAMSQATPTFDPPFEPADDQQPDTSSDMDSTGSGGAPVTQKDLPANDDQAS